MVCYKILVKDGMRKMVGNKNMCVGNKDVRKRWCMTKCWYGRRGKEEEEEKKEAEEDNTTDTNLKRKIPYNFIGKNSTCLYPAVRFVCVYQIFR